MDALWYKNAVFYTLDVETFYDSNDDGIGDFQGLIEKLDYIADMGVTCIWLLPFYVSPNRDNGYDVMDYYKVDERLGTMKDFEAFMSAAQKHGLRVVIDLVVNHTSHEHTWFQEARKNPESPFHDYYVWAEQPLPYQREHLMFTGEEHSVWSYDTEAKKYYLHRFYKEQPDLNIGNRRVQQEILSIMKFWLATGISGFRLDAAEILVEPYGMKDVKKEDLSAFMFEMRKEMNALNSEAVLIAEANLKPNEMKNFLKHNGNMQMIFNFFINQHIFLSLAERSATPLIQALKKLAQRDPEQQWLNFLRHHDELSLVLLNRRSRHIVFEKFAPEENMRIYGRGIRRRLAPITNNHQKVLKLCYSILFSLPGAPLVRYGDEIGMGENLSLDGRQSVRTPMQWSSENNGGFSNAPKENLIVPVIDFGDFTYERINTEVSARDNNSLFHWIKKLIALRKKYPEIGSGKLKIVPSENEHLLIHSYSSKDRHTLFIHNLSQETCSIHIDDISLESSITILSDSEEKISDTIQLEGYECVWAQLIPKKIKIWE